MSVPTLYLDAAQWDSQAEAWEDLGNLLGFPDWHGRNGDALLDSIEPGQINRIGAPYALHVQHASSAKPEAKEFIDLLTRVFRWAQERGSKASLVLEN